MTGRALRIRKRADCRQQRIPRVARQGRPYDGVFSAHTKKAHLAVSLFRCFVWCGTKSRTRDLLITSPSRAPVYIGAGRSSLFSKGYSGNIPPMFAVGVDVLWTFLLVIELVRLNPYGCPTFAVKANQDPVGRVDFYDRSIWLFPWLALCDLLSWDAHPHSYSNTAWVHGGFPRCSFRHNRSRHDLSWCVGF